MSGCDRTIRFYPVGNLLAIEVDEPMVGDGDLVGVAPEIGEDATGPGVRSLGVDNPVIRLQ